ncbi:hypothetical protein [Rothia nasimurium]|uniref:hypothetical protein n=1 Tax=Rothia nasimurium TaxID=85336 RepID=UPI001F234551|nr:hypothetical protein [Rothia nasimurium]
MSKEYPVEIYPKPNERIKDSAERIYDRGYADGQQAQHDLTGWSNLTEAIKAGERIDWGALDGLEAKCVHSEMGALTIRLDRQEDLDGHLLHPADEPNAWHEEGSELEGVIESSWVGNDDWALYIKGELPLRKLTADQLEPGTCFKGKCMGEVRDCLLYQGRPAYYEVDGGEVGPISELKVVGVNLYPQGSREGAEPAPVNWLASQVEVLEIYGVGTFSKPKEGA